MPDAGDLTCGRATASRATSISTNLFPDWIVRPLADSDRCPPQAARAVQAGTDQGFAG